MQLDWANGGLAEGLRCYRAEKFFEAHEHWEGVWLGSPEPEKTFLQALIQIAAAFHHVQRANPEGATSLLQRALRRLEAYPETFGGIAVAPLCEEIRSWVQILEAGKTDANLAFPQIRCHP